MTRFSKKSSALLALIALILFVGMVALIYWAMPDIDWSTPPAEDYNEPAAAFVYQTDIDKNTETVQYIL